MAAAAARADLYEALAGEAFDGDRAKAKVAMLGTIYGQTSGEAAHLLASLRQRFPRAVGFVEAAARAGEDGRLVRSVLGRTCPPPSPRWRAVLTGAASAGRQGEHDQPGTSEEADEPGDGRRAGQAARERGRFTRNFVIQASAADWALVLLAIVRARLAALPAAFPPPDALSPPPMVSPGDALPPAGAPAARAAPALVFFQHDELVVHAPREAAEVIVEAIVESGREASRVVFGDTAVQFPLGIAVVECYADAK
jgi:DNA polymerase-1